MNQKRVGIILEASKKQHNTSLSKRIATRAATKHSLSTHSCVIFNFLIDKDQKFNRIFAILLRHQKINRVFAILLRHLVMVVNCRAMDNNDTFVRHIIHCDCAIVQRGNYSRKMECGILLNTGSVLRRYNR